MKKGGFSFSTINKELYIKTELFWIMKHYCTLNLLLLSHMFPGICYSRAGQPHYHAIPFVF